MILCISDDAEALAGEAAVRFVQCARDAIAARGQSHIALSGGSTPRALYRQLAAPDCAAQVDWPRVHLWWSDERDVPRDHPDSNYRLAYDALICHVPIPPSNVHRVPTELGAIEAAAQYESNMIESLSHWAIESLGHFAIEPLGHFAIGPFGHWAIEPLTQWPNDSMTQWQNGQMTQWPNDSMTQWQNGQMTQWPNDSMTK